MSTFDLDKLGSNWELTAKGDEHPEERTARLKEESARNNHSRFKENVILWGALGFLLLGIGISLWLMTTDASHVTDEIRSKSATMFNTIIVGSLSFVTGRAVGKKDAD